MIFIQFIAKLIKILRSGATPAQLAGGMVLGMILGLTPLMSLHNVIVILLVTLINVNLAMFFLGFAIFSGFAYLLDPLFHNLGYWLLVDLSFLKGIWTALYNMPVGALFRLNNTVVLGSLVASLIFISPCFWMTKHGVILYRTQLDPKIQKWKVMQVLKSSKLVTVYNKIKQLGD